MNLSIIQIKLSALLIQITLKLAGILILEIVHVHIYIITLICIRESLDSLCRYDRDMLKFLHIYKAWNLLNTVFISCLVV